MIAKLINFFELMKFFNKKLCNYFSYICAKYGFFGIIAPLFTQKKYKILTNNFSSTQFFSFYCEEKVSFGGCEGVGNFVICNRKIIFIWKRSKLCKNMN